MHNHDEKQEGERHLSLLEERQKILDAQSNLTRNAPFNELGKTDQIKWCRLNKALAQNYWDSYQHELQNEQFQAATHAFANAYTLGHHKAITVTHASYTDQHNREEHLSPSLSADANYYSGLRAETGIGESLSFDDAVYWYKEAIKIGHAGAKSALAFLLMNNFKERNQARPLQWLHEAAEAGDMRAQNQLGCIYNEGMLVKKDMLAADSWLKRAAAQGCQWALYNLGYICHKRAENQHDLEHAIHLYWLSLEQGNCYAATRLKAMNITEVSYDVAMHENNLREIFTLILSDSKIEALFFSRDLVNFCNSNSSQMHRVMEALNDIDKNAQKEPDLLVLRRFTLRLIINLDKAIQTNSVDNLKSSLFFMQELIQRANFAHAEKDQINALVFCIAHRDDNVRRLITLWYHAKTCGAVWDEHSRKLLAFGLIKSCEKTGYQLNCAAQVNNYQLGILINAYENNKALLPEALNALCEPGTTPLFIPLGLSTNGLFSNNENAACSSQFPQSTMDWSGTPTT